MHSLTSIIAALRVACLAVFAATALILGATAAIAESSGKSEHPEKDVELDVLIEAIDEYGQWRQHEVYGVVWIPRVDEDWRPYTLGQWAHDDAAGWTWVSEEPFGWVVYHYGRWSQNDELGWFWVPGTKWAPAWVAWRESDEHIGWAPLPPEPPEYTGPPYEHTVIYDEPRYEAFWVFATYALFARPHIHRHAIWHRHRHYRGIYRKSRRGHHARWRHRRIVNRGIALRELRKRARRHIRPARVVVSDRAHSKRGRRSGHGLVHVYRPSPGTKPRRPRRHLHEGRRFHNADDRRAIRQRARAGRTAAEVRERRLERRHSDAERAQKRQAVTPERRGNRGAEALRRRAQQKRREADKRRARSEARSKARDRAARKPQGQRKERAQRKAQTQRKARARREAGAQRKARAQRRGAASRKVQRRSVQKRNSRSQRSVRRKAASRSGARASRARARPRAQARQRAGRPQKARSRGGQRRR